MLSNKLHKLQQTQHTKCGTTYVCNTIKIPSFSNWESWSKKPKIGGAGGRGTKKTLCHFGQVNFNLSSVIMVVFFTSRIWTI